MGKKRIRSIAVVLMLFAFVFTSTAMSFASSGTKKMTAYDEVIVKGKYAYCATAKGIYRVNIKTGQKKRIVKEKYVGDFLIDNMKIHKGYLYYRITYAIPSVARVKLSGKGNKILGYIYDGGYVISGDKIYYRDPETEKKMQMNLNGNHKKKSSVKFNLKSRKANKKGYRVKSVSKESEPYSTSYTEFLHRPKGNKIKLCTYTY